MSAPVTFTSSVLPPRERGLELGERFRAEIASTVGAYRRLWVTRAGGALLVAVGVLLLTGWWTESVQWLQYHVINDFSVSV